MTIHDWFNQLEPGEQRRILEFVKKEIIKPKPPEATSHPIPSPPIPTSKDYYDAFKPIPRDITNEWWKNLKSRQEMDPPKDPGKIQGDHLRELKRPREPKGMEEEHGGEALSSLERTPWVDDPREVRTPFAVWRRGEMVEYPGDYSNC